MMPAFSLSAFIDQAIIVWTDNPGIALAFCCVALVVASRVVLFAKVRVTHGRSEFNDEVEAVRRERDADRRKRLTQINDYRNRGKL